jgi:hypothetical protein
MYSYASDKAEFLQTSSFYGSAVWLDPWEAGRGIGDSLEDYRRVSGHPISPEVLSTKRTVLPLRTDCPNLKDTALSTSSLVYRGLPKKCWKTIPDLHGPYSYRVVIAGLSITNGLVTLDFDFDYVLLWRDGDGVWVENFVPVDLINLVPLGDYPDGTGLTLEVFFDDGPDLLAAKWILPEGSQQADWEATSDPILPSGWTLVTRGTETSTFVSVDEGWPVNPNDVFPP